MKYKIKFHKIYKQAKVCRIDLCNEINLSCPIGIILLIICADSLFSKKIITKNKTIETVSVFPISRKIKAKNIGNAHSVIMANRVSKTIVYVLSFQKVFLQYKID